MTSDPVTKDYDLISRQVAIKAILKVPDGNWSQKRYAQEIRKLPSVDSVWVRRGKWVYETKKILVDETDDGPVYASKKYWRCNACGKPKGFWTYKPDDKFCSECGADMRGDKDAVD